MQVLRATTRSPGTLNDIGRTREWTRVVDGRERTHVALTEAEGQVRIALDASYQSGVAMVYALSFIFGVTLTGIALDGGGLPDLANFAVATGGGAGMMAVARGGVTLWMRTQREKLTRMMDRLQNVVATTRHAEPSDDLAEAPPETTLDAAPLAEPPPAQTSASRPRTPS